MRLLPINHTVHKDKCLPYYVSNTGHMRYPTAIYWLQMLVFTSITLFIWLNIDMGIISCTNFK